MTIFRSIAGFPCSLVSETFEVEGTVPTVFIERMDGPYVSYEAYFYDEDNALNDERTTIYAGEDESALIGALDRYFVEEESE